MSPENEGARDGGDRAGPDTASKPDSIAPDAGAAINLRAWLLGVALDLQRADAAMLSLAFVGVAQ